MACLQTMLEYEVDSDDEWEEPEDGESLRGSEDEESQDEQYEEDNDMFVPHGYLSDGEGDDDFDDTVSNDFKLLLFTGWQLSGDSGKPRMMCTF